MVVAESVVLAITLGVCAMLVFCLVRQCQLTRRQTHIVMDGVVLESSDVLSTAENAHSSSSSSHTEPKKKKRPALFLKHFRKSYNALQTSSATPTPLSPGTRTLHDSIPVLSSTEVAAIPEAVETDPQRRGEAASSNVSVPESVQNGIGMETGDGSGNRISVADSENEAQLLDSRKDSRDRPV